MADAEISDYAAEAETLAERVDWARGSELTAALEELEAVSAAAPAEAKVIAAAHCRASAPRLCATSAAETLVLRSSSSGHIAVQNKCDFTYLKPKVLMNDDIQYPALPKVDIMFRPPR